MKLISNSYTRKLAPRKLRPRLNGPGRPLPEPKQAGPYFYRDLDAFVAYCERTGYNPTHLDLFEFQVKAFQQYVYWSRDVQFSRIYGVRFAPWLRGLTINIVQWEG